MTVIFAPREYEEAARSFISEAVRAVARASSPLLAQVRVEVVESLQPVRNTLSADNVVEADPISASASMEFPVEEGIAGNFDPIHAEISKAADDFASQIVPAMLEQISKLTEATGNVVPAKGRSFWEVYLEAIEKVEIVFDEDGNPSIPQVVMNPKSAKELGDPPAGFSQRLDEIINRKRDEWLAQRHSRRLPQRRH